MGLNGARHREWYATEYLREGPIEDWVTGATALPRNRFRGYLLLLNLDAEHEAGVELTFYYADQAPRQAEYTVGAGIQGLVYLGEESSNRPAGIPVDKPFGIRVCSNVPVVAQFTMGDALEGDPVTNNMVTHMLTPGPLGPRHRVWCYVDSIVLRSERALEEREWFTVLNPQMVPARVAARFIPGSMLLPPGQGPNRVASDHKPFSVCFTVPPERLMRKRLHEDIEEYLPNRHYSVIIESDVPVTVQAIRRIFRRGQYDASTSMPVLDALPIGPEA